MLSLCRAPLRRMQKVARTQPGRFRGLATPVAGSKMLHAVRTPAARMAWTLQNTVCRQSGFRRNFSQSFLGGTSSYYIEEMYRQWRSDPTSVHKSWDVYFNSGEFTPPPTMTADYSGTSGDKSLRVASAASGSTTSRDLAIVQNAIQMIRAFQVRGHYMADLDPLQLAKGRVRRTSGSVDQPQELTLEHWGFTEQDLDSEVPLDFTSMKGFLSADAWGGKRPTVRQLHKRLVEAYGGTIGVEYMHMPDVHQCNWVRSKFETGEKLVLSKQVKIRILERITWADHFERFLAKKFTAVKRFGLEGLESTIVCMKAVIDRASELGTESVVMGMPHRGRLNVLSTVVRKPMEQIFCEFHGGGSLDESEGSGDVKYHLGMSHVRPTHAGTDIRLSLVANPSHLEAVNPVVAGKTRAKQFYAKDTERNKVIGLTLHGDAAFAGQGVVYETMGMHDLPAYETGGTIHIICNNQIGFTTDPAKGRSTPYCTEIAKAVGAPIFHVNADDPEAVHYVGQLAAEWRAEFKKDVVIDIVGYRRHGHNEIDEPSFTQPRMYDVIRNHPSVHQIYSKALADSKIATEAELQELSDRVTTLLEAKFEAAKDYEPEPGEWLSTQWADMVAPDDITQSVATGVPRETLDRVGKAITTVRKGFTFHPRLKRVYAEREKSLSEGSHIDWGTAEALAFGSLLLEGNHVRLSGQDVERGTFSHRHAVLHDYKDLFSEPCVPLSALETPEKNATFSVSNSHLSEFGVLGFELGYSLENPRSLVLWEAQFGDFVNGAQVIIDQFLSAGEAKWRRQCGLVMLLPHGYEGQGPEHSSARLERFLQQSSDPFDRIPDQKSAVQQVNWQVVNMTSAANYFHALRRQIHRPFRKPLIVFAPKQGLRADLFRCSFDQIAEGTSFVPVIDEDRLEPNKCKRVVFCSGHVFLTLHAYREKHNIKDVALVRLEQYTPFPYAELQEARARYPQSEAVWCQEEPMNMGPWTYVNPRLNLALGETLKYVGRPASASPSTGSHNNHVKEDLAICEQALH